MSDHEVDSRPVPDGATEKVSPVAQRAEPAVPQTQQHDPTRYGDWEKDGRCIDF